MCSWVLGGCWSCRRGCREYGRAPCVSQTCLCCPAQARQVFYLTSQCVFSGLCPCRSYTSYETQLCLFIFCDFVLTLSMFLGLPGQRFNLSSFFAFASLLSLCANVLGLEAAPRQEGHPVVMGLGSTAVTSEVMQSPWGLATCSSSSALGTCQPAGPASAPPKPFLPRLCWLWSKASTEPNLFQEPSPLSFSGLRNLLWGNCSVTHLLGSSSYWGLLLCPKPSCLHGFRIWKQKPGREVSYG